MKPESIKTILKSYLEEKQKSYLKEKQKSSCYDDIDGISNGACGFLAAEPFGALEDINNDLVVMEPNLPEHPIEELNVPLEPRMEAVAIGIGRQLSQMSDEFELDCALASGSQSSAIGSRKIQFKENFIRILPTCGHVQIPIIRTGSADKAVNVSWKTCDKSAKAGTHYIGSEGNIYFAEGEMEKIIEIEIKNQGETSICFEVKLFDTEGTGFRTCSRLVVYIVDYSKLYADERQVVENIFNCSNNISVSEVLTRLRDNVTHNTFKAALLCLCSSAETIPKELALASELLRLTSSQARFGVLTKVFCDFFSYLPELEDITSLF